VFIAPSKLLMSPIRISASTGSSPPMRCACSWVRAWAQELGLIARGLIARGFPGRNGLPGGPMPEGDLEGPPQSRMGLRGGRVRALGSGGLESGGSESGGSEGGSAGRTVAHLGVREAVGRRGGRIVAWA